MYTVTEMDINLINPIDDIVVDDRKFYDLIHKYKLRPYFGSGIGKSLNRLRLIKHLSELSPSNIACENSICSFAFRGALDIQRSQIAGLVPLEELEDLTPTEKMEFVNLVTSWGISLPMINKNTEKLHRHYQQSGNAWLLIKVVNMSDDVQRVSITTKHYLDVMLLRELNDLELPYAVVTPEWSEDYWMTDDGANMPLVVPVSTLNGWHWEIDGNVSTTLLHIRNTHGKSEHYGRTMESAIMAWQYNEFSYGVHSTKVSATEFISKKILAFQRPDPMKADGKNVKTGFRNMARKIKKLVSNSGRNPHTLGVVDYDYGTKPPTAIPLDMNRDYLFMRETLGRSQNFIYAWWDWSAQLSGQAAPSGGIGSDALSHLFNMKNISHIEPLQSDWESIWSYIFRGIQLRLDKEPLQMTIKFGNKIEALVAKFQTGDNPQNAIQETVAEPVQDPNNLPDDNV